jgi:hypothetical protein
MHPGEPDTIFPAPRRPRKRAGKLVRQQPATQRPHRQTRDRLAASDEDRRSADGQDRYPGVDAKPETPKNPDIAPARHGIPAHQPPRSARAHHHWSTNTVPTAPISDSQASLQGSRTHRVLPLPVLLSGG